MAGTLYISYFGGVQRDVAMSPISSETVSTSTTSAQSGTIPAAASIAAIYSDVAHYVTQGANPTATSANGFYLPAGTMREICVLNNAGNAKLAAITLT